MDEPIVADAGIVIGDGDPYPGIPADASNDRPGACDGEEASDDAEPPGDWPLTEMSPATFIPL